MSKVRTWLLIGCLLVVPSLTVGCTDTSFVATVLAPLANNAIDGSVDFLLGILSDRIDEAAGDSPVAQAIGHGVSTTAGDLVDVIVDETVGDLLPDD